MPNADVLDIRMAFSDLCSRGFHTLREAFRVGFEVRPSALKLRGAGGERLPIIVDDQVRDLDVVLGERVEGAVDFLVSEVLAESVPSAVCEAFIPGLIVRKRCVF